MAVIYTEMRILRLIPDHWRTCGFKGSCGYGLLVLAALLTPPVHAADGRVVVVGAHALSARPDSLGIFLGDEVIVVGSVEVRADSVKLVVERDFSVDYLTNRLHITQHDLPSSSLWITWRSLPISHAPILWDQRPDILPADSVLGDETAPYSRPLLGVSRPFRKPEGADLRIGGSKTFSVDVGSDRDMAFKQALRVGVSGTLAEDVEVVAILSDQNLPIQPEGNTENLKELDRVLVEITTPHYQATLGDYDLNFDRTEFGSYQRRLEGAAGRIGYERFEGTLAIASSEGVLHTMEIVPTDGNRGPYRFVDAMGNPGVIVLAGTERVWIDGRQLRRGESNDYTIDYGAGEITFTRKRLITTDMRIVADYEFANQAYSHTTAAAASRGDFLDGRAELGVTLIQESDQAQQPLFFTMDETNQTLLRSAGDDPLRAATDGWVEDSLGSYDLIDSVFVHVESASGEYSVAFNPVGVGEGGYVRSIEFGEVVYQFVGEGLGTHTPKRLLPLPKRHRLGVVDGRLSPTPWIHLSTEMAMSDVDANVRSNIDDSDNQQSAIKGQAVFDRKRIGGLGEVSGRIEGRKIDRGFAAMSRTRDTEDSRRWGIGLTEERGEENSIRGLASYYPVGWLRVSPAVGWLRQGTWPLPGAVRSDRLAGGFSALPRSGWEARGAVEHMNVGRVTGDSVRTDRDIWRGDGTVSAVVWRVKPSLRTEYERSMTSQRGTRYLEAESGLASVGFESISASASVEHRTDDLLNDGGEGWEEDQRSITQTYRAATRDWGGLTASGGYTLRNRRYDMGARSAVVDVAEVDLHHTTPTKSVTSELKYRVSSNRTDRRIRVYRYVGPGNGRFVPIDEASRAILTEVSIDREVESGRPEGTYDLFYGSTGELRETVQLDASLRAIVTLGKMRFVKNRRRVRGEPMVGPPKLLKRALGAISTESVIRVKEADSTRNRDLYLAKFWKFRRFGSSPTVRGLLDMRQDVYLFRASPKQSWRLRFRSTEDFSADVIGGAPGLADTAESRLLKEYSIRRRSRHGAGRLEWEGQYVYRRQSRSGTRRFDFSTRLHQTTQRLSYHPNHNWEMGVEGKLGRAVDPVADASVAKEPDSELAAWIVSASPNLRRSWTTKGRIWASAEWSGVFPTNKAEGASLPLHLLGGMDDGQNWRWSANIDFRLSTYLTVQMTYDGRKTPGRRTVHQGRTEMRATF